MTRPPEDVIREALTKWGFKRHPVDFNAALTALDALLAERRLLYADCKAAYEVVEKLTAQRDEAWANARSEWESDVLVKLPAAEAALARAREALAVIAGDRVPWDTTARLYARAALDAEVVE